jgi:cell division septum initiation protein DivIVA
VRTLEQQIRSADFTLSRKGYNPSSVDQALEGFADNVARLLEQLRRESIRVSALERSLTFAQNGGTSVQPDLASLVVEASEMKTRLLDEARKQAAEIVETATKKASESHSVPERPTEAAASHRRESEIEMALEEAAAIESAAKDIAEAIRRQAESDADEVLAAARAAALHRAEGDTGTGADDVELAQQYR